LARPLILVADHNPFVRKSVREFLADIEADVHEALSGPELLEMAGSFHPNVIILEANLPGSGGRSVLKALKGKDGLRQIPVIILEEEGLPGRQARAEKSTAGDLSAGIKEKVFDVVRKPLERLSLVDAVRQALVFVHSGTKGRISKKSPADRGITTAGTERQSLQILSHDKEDVLDKKDQMKFAAFTDNDFERFQDFLIRKVGLYFDIKRKLDLAKALRHRIVALNMESYLDYYQYLSHSLHEEKELRKLVLYLTIGETTFFRSPDQFKAMREYILTRLLTERRKMPRPTLRIWSAGCSTGEEPYTIAITLREIVPDINNWDIRITATDINQRFLRFAQEGLYPPRKVRYVSDDILRRYFKREEGHYRLSPEIRGMVNFKYHNISVDSYDPFDGTDIIFCRNVLIYFRRDRIHNVIEKFHRILIDSGYLILGYSETLFQISTDFKSIHYGDAFFYVKADAEEEIPEITQPEPIKRPFPHQPVLEDVAARPISTRRTAEIDQTNPTFGHTSIPVARIQNEAAPVVEVLRDQSVMEEELTREETDERDALWEEGLNYYFYEQFDYAEDVFRKLAEKFTNYARSQLGLGFIHANKGEDSLARDKIERVLEMDNLLPEAYYLRALIEEKNGNIEAAMADYRNVILLDPDFAMAHFNLGILYIKQNRVKDSRREFRNTLNILKSYDTHHSIKFSGGLHREALIQLCEDLSE